MRKILFLFIAAFTLAACSNDSTAPRDDDSALLIDDLAVLAFGGMDMTDPGSQYIARLHSFPDSLKLTADQQGRIRALVAAFMAATKPDMEALRAIHEEARAAKAAGKSDAEIRAIFARGDAIRARLHAAETKLRADIIAVLTPAQQAWLNAPRQKNPCREAALQLTDAQKTQITALIAAFETANRADLDALKKIHEEARAAHAAGASREAIKAILDKGRAPMERLRAAQAALKAGILAVLTPEQRNSGCFGNFDAPGSGR